MTNPDPAPTPARRALARWRTPPTAPQLRRALHHTGTAATVTVVVGIIGVTALAVLATMDPAHRTPGALYYVGAAAVALGVAARWASLLTTDLHTRGPCPVCDAARCPTPDRHAELPAVADVLRSHHTTVPAAAAVAHAAWLFALIVTAATLSPIAAVALGVITGASVVAAVSHDYVARAHQLYAAWCPTCRTHTTTTTTTDPTGATQP